jgi:hypothetical protein
MCLARGARVGLEANKKANNFAGCLPATRTALDRKIIEPSKINGSIDFSRHSWMMKWRPGVESNYRQCDFQSQHSVSYHTETQAPSEIDSGISKALASPRFRLGGARVALVNVLIETDGRGAHLACAESGISLGGAVLIGFGCPLVYPGLGVEAVCRAPPQSRGLAMGAYSALLDPVLALATPAPGLFASECPPRDPACGT